MDKPHCIYEYVDVISIPEDLKVRTNYFGVSNISCQCQQCHLPAVNPLMHTIPDCLSLFCSECVTGVTVCPWCKESAFLFLYFFIIVCRGGLRGCFFVVFFLNCCSIGIERLPPAGQRKREALDKLMVLCPHCKCHEKRGLLEQHIASACPTRFLNYYFFSSHIKTKS